MKNNKFLIIISIVFILIAGVYFYNQSNTQVEINFYAHDDDAFKEIIADYEKENPDVKINLVPLSDNTDEKLIQINEALVSDQKKIDLIDSDIIWVNYFAKNDHILPLDDYFSNDELEDYLSSPLNGNIINNKLYGIPYRTDTGLLYYRKDLLKKYGFNPPETFEELVKITETIMPEEKMYGYAGSWYSYEGLTCNALEFLWTFGGEVHLDEKTIINKEDNKTGFKKMKYLIENEIAHPNILEFTSGDVRNAFINNEIIFMRDWPTGVNYLKDTEMKDKFDITFLPFGKYTGNNSGSLGGWQLIIPKENEHPKETVDFIKFFTNYENNKKLVLEHSYTPIRKDLFRDPDVTNQMPFLRNNMAIFNNSKPRPFFKDYTTFTETLQNNLTLYLQDEMTIEEFMKKTEYKYQSEFKND